MLPLTTFDHLQRIFDELDKNGDGVVSVGKLMSILERIGVHTTQDELELLIGQKTLNFIDFLFFSQTLTNNNVHIQEKSRRNNPGGVVDGDDDVVLERDLREAFRVFDLNNDGFISCEELQIALSRLGLWGGQDCRHMIGVYDTNSDGLLDFQEFKDMMLLGDQPC